MADRIAVMKDGALVQCGTPHEVYERPADRFVADFIGQMNFFSGTVEGSILRSDSGRDIRTGEAGSIGLGARAVAAVRPERLRLSASAADNTATGTVLALAYHGTDLQVHVATDLSPDPVLVRIAADAAERHSVQEGGAVELGWSARDTRLFPM